MTVIPGAGGQTLSLVCDSCGQSINDIESPPDHWAVVWAVISRTGWTGSPLAIGPHHCAQCGPTPRDPAVPRAGAYASGGQEPIASLTVHPHACVLGLRGQLDLLFASELRDTLSDAIRRNPDVVLEMAGVRLLDSTALGQLVHARELARSGGGGLYLAGTPYAIQTVLETMRVRHLFPSFPNTAAALHHLAAARQRQRSSPSR